MWLNKYLNLQDSWNIKKQKVKIAFFFALFVSFLIIFFQIFFLLGKYLNHKNSQLGLLGNTADRIVEYTNNICPDFDCDEDELKEAFEGEPPRGQMQRGRADYQRYRQNRVLERNEFVLFSNDLDFSFVSFQNPDLEKFLKQKIINSWISSWSGFFEYEGVDFIYKLSLFDKNSSNKVFVFENASFSTKDMFNELLIYFLLTTWMWSILFFVSYYFVSKNLKPIENNIKDMQEFVHNAGHELKTPISWAKSSLQLAQKTWDYQESVNNALYDLDKMALLIDALLQLSDIKKDDNIKEFSVVEKINQTINTYQKQIEEKKLKINFNERQDFVLEANPDHFLILISNLISNAIKYNTVWANIDITVGKKFIKITDQWEGISSEDKEKIFDRFFKAGSSREVWGFGIGLSLVKKIVDLYGWEIQVESKINKWTSFKVYF